MAKTKKQALREPKSWKAVRLSHKSLLMLKFMALTSNRSMANILEQFIEEVFFLMCKYKENQLWFDTNFMEDKIILTVAGRYPRMVIGKTTEKELKGKVEAVFNRNKKKRIKNE